MKLAEFVARYKPEILLENYHRRTLERLDQLDFAELEKRILSSQLPDSGRDRLSQLVLGVDFATPGYGDLTTVCIARRIWMDKDEIKMMIVDDVYTHLPPKLMEMEIGHIDGFRFIESPLARTTTTGSKFRTSSSLSASPLNPQAEQPSRD